MRNTDNFRPSRSTRMVGSSRDVFVDEGAVEAGENPWLKTSVSLRTDTRNRVKLYAAGNGLKIQEVVETALTEYLDRIGG